MAQETRVVIRYRSGEMLKGFTFDFAPNRDRFHVVAPDESRHVTEVSADELKAVFYVKSFEGDADHPPGHGQSREVLDGVPGLKLKVTFEDGEVLLGTTNGYNAGRKGFFVIPAGANGNNERIYVFSSATASVETWR